MGRGATFWPVCRVTVLGSAYSCVFKVRQSAQPSPLKEQVVRRSFLQG